MQKEAVPAICMRDAELARQFMHKVAALGFGECVKGTQARSLKFRRHPLRKMSKGCQAVTEEACKKNKK